MRRLLAVFTVLVFGLLIQASAASADKYSATSLNIMPSGQWGSIPAPPEANSQALMYDALTPLFNNVTWDDIQQNFKSQEFGVGPDGPATNEVLPRDDVKITRDRYNVPHVKADTYDAGVWAAGWIAQQDRGILLAQLRYVARAAAIDLPNTTAIDLLRDLANFVPSAETEAVVAEQEEALLAKGPDGQQALDDIDTYVDGMNDYFLSIDPDRDPDTLWARNDIFSLNSVKRQFLGQGGGDEARRSQFLAGLQDRLGGKAGWKVFDDLAQFKNNGLSANVDGKFPYGSIPQNGRAGTVIIDHNSYEPVDPVSGGAGDLTDRQPRQQASNTLMVTKKKSATNKPLMIGGPQIAYSYPGLTYEIDMDAPGLKWRGMTTAFAPGYLVLGRGEDFSNTLTSASADLVDQYAETLCEGSDTKYRYNGECRDMEPFFAGELNGDPVNFMTTVHGPVTGYATVDGRRVAISSKRAGVGTDTTDVIFNQRMSDGTVKDVESFFTAANQSPQTYNSFYIDDKDIGMFTSGRLPIRHPQVDPRLLTKGTGQYEWTGFLNKAGHMQGKNPKSGLMVNWNQTAAKRFAAADDEWGRNGSVNRVDLLNIQLKKNRNNKGRWDLPAITSAMNSAATQDVRAVRTVPLLRKLLNGSKPPTGQAGQMLKQMRFWNEKAGSRLDRNDDGLIDHPGAASMDRAWNKIADAFMGPQLGSQLDELNSLFPRYEPAQSGPPRGQQYSGWHQYFDRDVKKLLGESQPKPFKRNYCGKGDLKKCQTDVWNAIAEAGQELEAQYSSVDPSQWRADATAEEISFEFVNIQTMAYTNRPSGYQQIVAYKDGR